jgi:hypothetical protein
LDDIETGKEINVEEGHHKTGRASEESVSQATKRKRHQVPKEEEDISTLEYNRVA